MEFRGGKGGYGGITNMDQDGRTSSYAPHITISKLVDYLEDEVAVTCRDCGESWRHPRGLVKNTPATCEKPEREDVKSGTTGTGYGRRWNK